MAVGLASGAAFLFGEGSRRISLAGPVAVNASAAVSETGCGSPSCPRPYRLIRLCEVLPPDRGGRPEGLFNLYTSDNTFGISDDGFVVGTARIVNAEDFGCGAEGFHTIETREGDEYEVAHAFLWLPSAAFGLAASPNGVGCADSVYDLHDLAGFSWGHFSFANDINAIADDGDGNPICAIVGVRFCNPDDPKAILWRLHTHDAGATPRIATFDLTPSGSVAYAYAVSEPAQIEPLTDTLEVVVAGRRAATTCLPQHIATAASVDVTGPLSVVDLPPFDGVSRSSGIDVAILDASLGSPYHRVVGYDTPTPTNQCSTFSFSGPECNGYGIDSHWWTGATSSTAYSAFQPDNYPAIVPPPNPPPTPDGQARGVNAEGWSVGWGRSPLAGSSCLPHAVVHEPLVQDITPDQAQTRRSRAEAISDVDSYGLCTVVGWSPDAQRALVWRGAPGQAWCESDATLLTLNDVDCVESQGSVCLPEEDFVPSGVSIQVVELHDVNRYGHAVGVIRERKYDGNGALLSETYFAAVLGPAADLDENLRVGASDLAILLGEWGAPAPSIADLNGDGNVNLADLSILTGSWEFVGGLSQVLPPSPPTCSCGELGGSGIEDFNEAMGASASMPLDPEALAAGLATLGFADVPAFAQWVASASEIEIDGAIAFLHHYAGQ